MAAALPAFCSWRNEITRIPEACARRPRSVIGMPGTLYIVLMPFSISASMTRWNPSVSSVSGALPVCSCAADISPSIPQRGGRSVLRLYICIWYWLSLLT